MMMMMIMMIMMIMIVLLSADKFEVEENKI